MTTITTVLNRLKESTCIGVDVETSGLDWRKNHIVGYVLTFGPKNEDSYYLPIRHAPGGNCVETSCPQTTTGWDGSIPELEAEIVRQLDRQDKYLVFHNGAFDLKFLYRVGLTKFDARMEDTMINATLLNEWQSAFSLDYCCKVNRVAQKKVSIYEHIAAQFGVPNDKNTMGHFWRLRGDDPQAVEYAAGDGTSTWQLRDKQQIDLDAQNLRLVHDIECKLIPVLARMSTRGVKIDEERLFTVKRILEQKIEEAMQALPEGFNSRSPVQVRKLMEESGFTDWPLTPKGAPSFPETWMVKNPIGQKIIKARKCTNMRDSFIVPMMEYHMWNGRCHPDYNQLRGDEYGTITGRLSSSNPNLQQVSKRNKELGWLHRSIFVPDEGQLWGSADWSQMEPRLLAFYSRCKVLLEGYRATPSIDAHQSVATAANINRETGKRVNQTLVTGGGKRVLTDRYGIPPDVVETVWNKYFEAMPEIKTFQKMAARRMRDRGYVLSLLGRKCRLNDPNKDYVALNRLLQGGNADAIKYKMVQIDEYTRSVGGINMLNNVHDSLDYQFTPGMEQHYKEALRIMTCFDSTQLISLDVPIEVDNKEGKSWAEATWGPDAGG